MKEWVIIKYKYPSEYKKAFGLFKEAMEFVSKSMREDKYFYTDSYSFSHESVLSLLGKPNTIYGERLI
jgi:hypothetical protein